MTPTARSRCRKLVAAGHRQLLGTTQNRAPIWIDFSVGQIICETAAGEIVLYDCGDFAGELLADTRRGHLLHVSIDEGYVVVECCDFSGARQVWWTHSLPLEYAKSVLVDVTIDSAMARDGIFLQVRTPAGSVDLLSVDAVSINVIWRAVEHTLVYADSILRRAIWKQERTPHPARYLWTDFDSRDSVTLGGIWQMVCDQHAICLDESEHGSVLITYALIDARELSRVATPLPALAVQRLGSRQLLCILHECGVQQAYRYDPATGQCVPYTGIDGCLRVTPGPDHTCFIQGESLLRGLFWAVVQEETVVRYQGAVAPSAVAGIRTQQRLPCGTPVLLFAPAAGLPSAAVVSFHGGPESCEFDMLRHWGWYRDLLAQNIAVVIVNYAGSIGSGRSHRQRPWNDWFASLADEWRDCLCLLHDRWQMHPQHIVAFGGSFGGTLALLSPLLVPELAGVLAVAPMVDLQEQMAKVHGDGNAESWFAERFALDHEKHRRLFSAETYLRNRHVPVTIIHGTGDPLTSHAGSAQLVKAADQDGLSWRLVSELIDEHLPTNADAAFQRLLHLQQALEEFLPG